MLSAFYLDLLEDNRWICLSTNNPLYYITSKEIGLQSKIECEQTNFITRDPKQCRQRSGVPG